MVNNGLISRLGKKSRDRIKNMEKYKKLIEKIEKFKKQISDKMISLKEESLIEKQRQKEFEKNFTKDEKKKIIDLENDLFLREAFNITGDYINMLGR
jgi:hypothetical protein